MNIKELMIGDLVKVSHLNKVGKIYRLDCANGDKNSFIALLDGDFSYNDIEPIPLTPEILEKNGWYHGKFDGSYGRKAMRLDGTYKDKLPDGVDNALSFAQWSIDEKFEYHLLDVYLWRGSVHLWIEYVHQLQHVLKLCGIEKTIEL